MPMPHEDMKRLIVRRLRGTDGAARLRVIEECMEMLPGYRQGPYADLRKWLSLQSQTTRTRRKVRHAEEVFVRAEGDARIVLVGPPNAGKSSILKAICGSQVQVGDYPFTTLRPMAATAVINDARIQLVEVPGLIEGARENRGHGRLYLGAAQDAGGFLLILPLQEGGLDGFMEAIAEVDEVIDDRPSLVVATKADLPGAESAIEQARRSLPGRRMLAVSTVAGAGLDQLKQAIWEMAGLMRVYSEREAARPGLPSRPFILPRGSRVEDLAESVHKDLPSELARAIVTGPSAKFAGQVVGLQHSLMDGDRVELVRKRK